MNSKRLCTAKLMETIPPVVAAVHPKPEQVTAKRIVEIECTAQINHDTKTLAPPQSHPPPSLLQKTIPNKNNGRRLIVLRVIWRQMTVVYGR